MLLYRLEIDVFIFEYICTYSSFDFFQSGKFLRFNGPVEAYQLNYIATVLHEVVCGTRTENIFPVLPNTVNVSFRGVRAAKLMPTLIDKVSIGYWRYALKR